MNSDFGTRAARPTERRRSGAAAGNQRVHTSCCYEPALISCRPPHACGQGCLDVASDLHDFSWRAER